jgi:ABC-2 type transport system ATP-binding protein
MIRVRNLVKRFEKVQAIRSISFDVRPGEIFALLGPNGAGKTTTIKIITTLLAPTSGEVLLDGINVQHNPTEARKRIGIVFQDSSLDTELTVLENMLLHAALYKVPAARRKIDAQGLLSSFALWERRHDIVKQLSGGMCRRLEIARALMHAPKLLLLDEPTLGLDPKGRNSLWAHVAAMRQERGITVMLSTHHMDETERIAHRVAIIDRGKIVATGSPLELRERTKSSSLEAAFLKLTGADVCERLDR